VRIGIKARDGRAGGYTMIELLVACFLALIVVLALGRIILANQRAWGWGRDKAILQANVTEAVETMGRAVRAADSLVFVSATEFHTYFDGSVAQRFKLATVNGEGRLQQNGANVVDRRCTLFSVTGDPEARSATVNLEFEDKSGNRISARSRAAVRAKSFKF